MPIPDYQSIMLPVVKLVADKQEHSLRNAITKLALQFNLTEAEKSNCFLVEKQYLITVQVGRVLI